MPGRADLGGEFPLVCKRVKMLDDAVAVGDVKTAIRMRQMAGVAHFQSKPCRQMGRCLMRKVQQRDLRFNGHHAIPIVKITADVQNPGVFIGTEKLEKPLNPLLAETRLQAAVKLINPQSHVNEGQISRLASVNSLGGGTN